jgi:hypothetical protein
VLARQYALPSVSADALFAAAQAAEAHGAPFVLAGAKR